MASAKVIILDLADTLTTAGRLQSDALKFLENAKRTHRLVLISNASQQDLDDLLQDYRIYQYFDLVLSAAEFEMKKPDPRIVNTALALLKDKTGERISKENVVLVGDRPDTDIKAGNLAGILTIRIKRGSYANVDPDFDDEIPKVEFKTLEEAGEYLGILAAQPEKPMKTVPAMPRAEKKAVSKKAMKKKVVAKPKKKASKKKGVFGNFL